MKKRSKHKGFSEVPRHEPDIAGLIGRIQQQLVFLEKKMDTLISQTSARPFEVKRHPEPFQRPEQSHRQNEMKQVNLYRERVLHKAICADCNKECEVPFKPSGDRPVYCKECFSKRKAGNSFKGNTGGRPVEVKPVPESPSHKHHVREDRKPGRKKQAPIRRKKRS